MTLSTVTNIAGSAGNFTVSVNEAPRYVDMTKCIACGLCTDKCPKKVDSEYDAATGKRKAIYVKYAQAVPLKYQIDGDSCLRLTAMRNGKEKLPCGFCEDICPAGAINYNDTEKLHEINVGAVVLAPGFEAHDPTNAGVWGYGVFPNVITAMQLERYLSASGPTEGHIVRPSDGAEAKKIAFLQCIGSRDLNLCGNGYCSSVCCMYAIKEAVMTKEHVPGLETDIFYMDMRTHGKDFDKYLEKAKTSSGVRFVRSRVNGIEPQGENGDLRLKYIDENGLQKEEFYDMVVLSVGLEVPKQVLELAEIAGIEITKDKFAKTGDFSPVQTSREGIFTCGAFAGPKDIPQSVVEGSAAAAAVAELLAPARNELTKQPVWPTERDIKDEEPKIGVFVCHCGSNIAGVVDVKAVEAYAATLPFVTYVERNLFSCSQDAQEKISAIIKEKGLNRIVIAACTPRTHEPLFRETLKAAGLNEYLIEMANIRNHNSWVHSDTPDMATAKAKDLVRMAAAKISFGEALSPIVVPINQNALVIGGGVAGMTSALNLAEQGFVVSLVEKSDVLGGHALQLKHTWSGEDVVPQVKTLADKITWNENITVFKQSEVVESEGFVGNFKSTIKSSVTGDLNVINHGVGVVAIGAVEFKPTEYGYGEIANVVTASEFDHRQMAASEKNFVFIQCVGSREEGHMYCSKVCCTHSVQAAIELKEGDPSRNVYVLYREMRTYGQREVLYQQARKLGVLFINYDSHGKPVVSDGKGSIQVDVWDHVLHRPLRINADVLVLATAIRPNVDTKAISQLYKVPVDADGFFLEAHAKLRPVDFTTDGMYVAGMAHYPKPIEESVAQSLAASARAATVLSKTQVSLDAVKATVDPDFCDGCALCVDVCPYNAISLGARDDGKPGRIIYVNKAKCKGCGLCQGTCPKRGVYVAGFTMDQISSQITAALEV